jgi:hypothetical protein
MQRAYGAPLDQGPDDGHLDPVAAPEMIDTACPAYFVDL